ncbi:MAG: hypothetical protein ACN4E6_01570 [Qipengyuania pacifica]
MSLFFHMADGCPAFFDEAVHGDGVPLDAVEITTERHAELLAGQANGKIITATADGKPRLTDQIVKAADRRASLVAAVKREASRRIEVISPIWRQLNDMRADASDEAAQTRFAMIDAIRTASDQIEKAIAAGAAGHLAEFPISKNPLWPEAD